MKYTPDDIAIAVMLAVIGLLWVGRSWEPEANSLHDPQALAESRVSHLIEPTPRAVCAMQGSQPKCPRCSGDELTLMSVKQTPSQPGRRPLYVYKCACGLYFTSDDPPTPLAPTPES